MITFKGRAYVYWTESNSSGTGTNSTRSYTATENYFKEYKPVFGKGCGEKTLFAFLYSFSSQTIQQARTSDCDKKIVY
jgi:hypothetical protein